MLIVGVESTVYIVCQQCHLNVPPLYYSSDQITVHMLPSETIYGENQPLVTDEPVESEK